MKKRNWKTIGIGIATIFIYFFVQLFAGDLLGFFGLDTSSINTHIKFLYLTVVDILILSSILLINHKTIEHDFKDILKNHKKYFSKGINYWLISLIVMMASNLIIMLFFNNAIANNEDTIRTMLKINPIYVYFSAVFFAPVVEELVFRQSIRNIIKNDTLFIIVSGLVFGSLHVIGSATNWTDFLYIIPYSAPGIAFACMLAKTKNIFTSIGFHFMHNGILVGLQFLVLLFG